MIVPKNILRFEVLLYLSLVLDCVSSALFNSDLPDASKAAQDTINFLSAALIGFSLLLVWLAARRQKNWARWTLFALFALSVASFIEFLRTGEAEARTIFDILSLGLGAVGLYYAFTPESRGWFRSPNA
jgi:peptidoglycan/LPS O-acetylase OafA/YrhL